MSTFQKSKKHIPIRTHFHFFCEQIKLLTKRIVRFYKSNTLRLTLSSKISWILRYLILFIKAKINPSTIPALQKTTIGKYVLYFYSTKDLVFLLGEIFFDQQYYFYTTNPRPLIIDGGSNTGLSVLYFKHLYPNAHIIAFEPAPDAYKALQKIVTDNNLNNVTCYQKALYSHRTHLSFALIDKAGVGASIYRQSTYSCSVETTTLSPYITKNVDLLKLDIEGAEQTVVKELCNANKLQLFKQMIIEFHHHIDKNINNFSQLLCLLERHNFGYQIHSVYPPPFNLTRQKQFQDILLYCYKAN